MLSSNNNVETISRWVLALLLLLTVFEIAFFPSGENIYGCFTFILGWLLLSKFVMKQRQVNNCFIPFIALFGIGMCFYFFPLFVTLFEGKPLTYNFSVPYLTFTCQLLNLMMLIAAYRLCLKVYRPTNSLTRLWSKLGYFTPPTDAQIWIMGFIGIASQRALLAVMGTDDARAENLGFIGHLLGVTKTFSAFPCLLLFKHLYTDADYKKAFTKPIILYLILLAVLGLATGKRTAMFSSFVTIGVCYILPLFTENKKLFTQKMVFATFFGIYIVTGPFVDFAIAIALGRDNSGNTSAERTLEKIWDIYQDKERLNTMYKATLLLTDNKGDNLHGWSEYYVDNIVMDRFCNLRVCDMSIDYAEKLGFDNPRMQEYASNYILFLVPTPILQAFGVTINKFEHQYTPGDLFSMEALNIKYYHGYRVAGDVGIGLYLWGWWYYLFAFFIYFVLFYFLSSTVKMNQFGALIFPLPVLIAMFRHFLLFNNGTGILGVLSTILRTGWQAIVVYCIIFFVIRKIVR